MDRYEVSSKYEHVSWQKCPYFLPVKLLNEVAQKPLMNNGGNKTLRLSGKQHPLRCFSLVSDVMTGFRSLTRLSKWRRYTRPLFLVLPVFSCLSFFPSIYALIFISLNSFLCFSALSFIAHFLRLPVFVGCFFVMSYIFHSFFRSLFFLFSLLICFLSPCHSCLVFFVFQFFWITFSLSCYLLLSFIFGPLSLRKNQTL